MRFRLPMGLSTNLPAFLKKYTAAAVLLGAAGMFVLLKVVFPSTPITPVQQTLRTQEPAPIHAQTDQKAPLQKLVEDQRQKNADQATALDKLQHELAALRTESQEARQELRTYKEQTAERETRQRDQFAKELAAARKRGHESQASSGHSQTIKAGLPTPSPMPAVSVALPGKQFELRTLYPKPDTVNPPLPPLANAEETAYLPLGCHAQIKFASGTMASSRVGEEYFGDYVLFTINNTFYCPMKLGGPHVPPVPSGIDASGCVGLARAKADLAKNRVQMRAEYLSCVGPDGSAYEPKIKGFVLDKDGTQGVVGELHTYESAKIGKAFIAGLIQEASAAFGLAKSQIVVTDRGLGGTQFPGAASQSIIQQIATYWLQQAQALQPVLWVHAGEIGYLVLQEGLPLQGYPVAAVVKGMM